MVNPDLVELLREIDKSEPRSMVVTWTDKNGVTTSRFAGYEGNGLIVSMSYQKFWLDEQLRKAFRGTTVSSQPPVIHGPSSMKAALAIPVPSKELVRAAVREAIAPKKKAKKAKRS
jgi:hypothetical protein